MRGAGGQIETLVVNGANKVPAVSCSQVSKWWSALRLRAKMGRCLLSSSRSGTRYCYAQFRNSRPLATYRDPLNRIMSTMAPLFSPCPVLPCRMRGMMHSDER